MGKRISSDILNDIIEYVTLVLLVENRGNISRAVSILSVWIYGKN